MVWVNRVEFMLFRCHALTRAEKAVGELLAIIGQNGADMDWTRTFQVMQKALGIGGCLVAIYGNEDPAAGPVYRHKEIFLRRLLGYLWQIFYVNVNVSGIIRSGANCKNSFLTTVGRNNLRRRLALKVVYNLICICIYSSIKYFIRSGT